MTKNPPSVALLVGLLVGKLCFDRLINHVEPLELTLYSQEPDVKCVGNDDKWWEDPWVQADKLVGMTESRRIGYRITSCSGTGPYGYREHKWRNE